MTLDSAPPSWKKGIWVDGASFWNMLTRVLHVKHDFNKIYDYLVNKTGTTNQCFRSPRYVLNNSAAGLEKLVRGAGFDPVVIPSCKSEDDEFIKNEIRKVTPNDLDEIILVAADGDYIPCLAEKVAQGIHVVVVATKVRDAGSLSPRMMVSSGLLDSRFGFVELADVCAQLGTKICPENKTSTYESMFKVVSAGFEISDAMVLQAVISSLSQLTIRHPSISKFTLEVS